MKSTVIEKERERRTLLEPFHLPVGFAVGRLFDGLSTLSCARWLAVSQGSLRAVYNESSPHALPSMGKDAI